MKRYLGAKVGSANKAKSIAEKLSISLGKDFEKAAKNTNVKAAIKKTLENWAESQKKRYTDILNLVEKSAQDKKTWVADEWKKVYPDLFSVRTTFEQLMFIERYAKAGLKHTDVLSLNFRAIDFYEQVGEAVNNVITASKVISMKTTRSTDINAVKAAFKSNIDDLFDRKSLSGRGWTGNGTTIKYSTAELHIYVPKGHLTATEKANWISTLQAYNSDISYEIKELEDFIFLII